MQSTMRVAAIVTVLLSGCARDFLEPPYELVYCDAMTEADRDIFRAAADEWNVAAGFELFADEGEPVDICVAMEGELPAADDLAFTWPLRPRSPVRYREGSAKTAAAHELGHVAGLEHEGNGLMHERPKSKTVTEEDARLVRERWGR